MNYYNDHDPNACAWIQGLIDAGLIPPGDVDSRSILEISPDELKGYTQCHFFCGIAGWPLALALAGWPATRPVWTGSCPCQPFSAAGQGKGAGDDRHLWSVFHRLISKLKPERVLGEQVAQAIGFNWLDGVSADLEADGYAVGAIVLGAHSVGSPNIRQRLFWVADSNSGRREQRHAGQRPIPIAAENRPTDRLADLFREGPQGHAGNERNRNQPGRIGAQAAGPASTGGESLRLADAESQREGPIAGSSCEGVLLAQRDGGACGLGNTSGARTGRNAGTAHPAQEERRGERVENGQRCGDEPFTSGDAYWRRSLIIPCRDGKLRRIPAPAEPGVLRMAHGLPEDLDLGWILGAFPLCEKIQGRTALLRGFGNAINPVVAAEFIQAFMETR